MSYHALASSAVAALALILLASLQTSTGQEQSTSDGDHSGERRTAGNEADVASGGLPLGCRGSSGELVDWWVILKLPNGTCYGYTTSEGAAAFSDRAPSGSFGEERDKGRGGATRGGEEFRFGAEAGGWAGSRRLNRLKSPLSRTLLPLYDPGAAHRSAQ